jgi:tRNA nucleotidyltransferase (CCA-adding enzyme)
MRDRETSMMGMKLDVFHENSDVVYGQLRKAVRAITRLCNRSGFPVIHSDFAVIGKDCLLLCEYEVAHLPVVVVHHGPEVGEGNEVEFWEKWVEDERTLVGPYVEDGSWRVDVIRPHANVEDLLTSEVPNLNLGKHVTKVVSEGMVLLKGDELLHKMYRPTLTRFFLRTPPWMWGVEPEA